MDFYFSVIHPDDKRLLALDHLAVNLSSDKVYWATTGGMVCQQ
jgi:hypothetical protein